jgi:hypothetical protein
VAYAPAGAAVKSDALRIVVSDIEVKMLAAVGTIPGVAVLAAGGGNGPGTGVLRSTVDGTFLSWKAPGSNTFGPEINCSVDGTYHLADGESGSAWLRVQVYNAYLTGGGVERNVYLADVYENGVSHDDVTAAEAAAGDITDYTLRLYNDSSVTLSRVKFWAEAYMADRLGYKTGGVFYFWVPISELNACSLADIPVGSYITLYLRRVITAGADPDEGFLNHLHFAFCGL